MATRKTTASAEETSKEVTVKAKENKKFDKEDAILCRSITSGRLTVEGAKSGNVYRWADYGDEEYVEYQDLIFMVRGRQPWVYKPRFIIENDDFIAENKQIEDLYNSMYTVSDFREILELPDSQMKSAIDGLPSGAKEAIKGIVATMVDDGELDSLRKIRTLDEIFDTNLLLTLAER